MRTLDRTRAVNRTLQPARQLTGLLPPDPDLSGISDAMREVLNAVHDTSGDHPQQWTENNGSFDDRIWLMQDQQFLSYIQYLKEGVEGWRTIGVIPQH